MNERDAFIRGIAANLYDDTARLAFADWLDEHREPERAEFIRVQCELEPIRDKYEIPRAAELHEREDALVFKHSEKWTAKMPTYPGDGWAPHYDLRRGFVDTVGLTAARFIKSGRKLRVAYPTIRRVVIFQLNGWGERLAACKALEGLAELELACWYSDDDARAVAASPHLSELQVLELWLARNAPLRDGQLCRITAAGKAWPKLRELALLNPDGEKAAARKRLVATANTAAGREVAVYRRGYPELFPFAPDNRVGEPGHLPDGRMALVSAYPTGDPLVYEVLTFDAKGKQTDKVITVPAPAEFIALPQRERDSNGRMYRKQVCAALGLTPAFIRIQGYSFQSQPGGASRDHYEDWDQLGEPDPAPEEYAEEELETMGEYDGYGERIYHLVRNGEFVVADGGWWCSKRGHVHST